MNRHHPYGGYDDNRRRSASPPGARFTRSDRGGRGAGSGGGFGARGGFRGGRGRGGFTGYEHSNPSQSFDPYDQGSYDTNANVNNDYNNSPFGGGSTMPSFNSGGSDGGNQNQNGSFSGYQGSQQGNDDWGEDSQRGGAPRRRQRDDKVHDSIIEERIRKERPCRTLFIRNIKYESDSAAIRRQFEEHGEIKTFFDIVSNRGMVFVTYYDLRAAERARQRLQGTEITGRPIDVHYSLPRGDEQQQHCDRDKNQGTLLVTLRNSHQAFDENELRRKFQQFGDVKSVKPSPNRPDQRYIELYDTRASEQAHDRLRHQGLQDGVMDIEFAWDIPDTVPFRRDDSYGRDFEESNRDSKSQGRGRGRGGRGGGGHYHEDYDGHRDRDSFSRERAHDDGYGGRGGGPGGSGYRGGSSRGGGGGYSSPARGNRPETNFGGGGYRSYGENSPAPPAVDERLEAAKKVQQLLAALKNPQAAPAAATPPPPPPQQAAPTNQYPNYAAPVAPMNTWAPPAQQQQPSYQYGAPAPPAGQPLAPPPFSLPPPQARASLSGPTGYPPPPPPPQQHPQVQQNQPPAAAPNPLAGLPPAVLALLQQQATAAQQQSQPQPSPYAPPQQQQGPPAQSSQPYGNQPPANPGAVPQIQNPQAMQHLLALLAQQQQQQQQQRR